MALTRYKNPNVEVPFSDLIGGALRASLHDGYGAAELKADVLAGLVVGMVALPLSMALAIAVGVAPQHGLYTAIVAGLIVAALGAVFSVALPVAAQITRASHSDPYLALKLDLDPHKIADLVLKVFPHGLPPVQERSAVYLTPVGENMISAATRLMECLPHPGDVELLAPLVIDEILIRLLRSPIGVRVAQMGFDESSVHRVAKAISWLRANFSQPMKVDDLAGLVHMSVSSFHEHFKSVTSMSPLHYQKVLRLQEARRLMLSTMMDAGTASERVGYLSPSQFSREYSRFFGNAPTKDIARLRQDTRLWA